MGEVYWDLEWDLQQLGFNFTYDKRLYDRLKSSRPEDIRGHLRADREYQQRSVRFIENHDEERSAACLGTPRAMAAAAVTATIQGLRFFQDGQLEGKRLRTPIHLRREAPEKNDPSLVDFYRMLLDYIKAPVFQSGAWKLVECGPSSEFNETYRNLLAWSWESENDRRLIVINYSEEPAQAWLPAEFFADQGKTSRLRDRRTGEIYKRDREELLARGLYVDLKPWQMHLFELVMTRKGA
jgi:hypothetical protein